MRGEDGSRKDKDGPFEMGLVEDIYKGIPSVESRVLEAGDRTGREYIASRSHGPPPCEYLGLLNGVRHHAHGVWHTYTTPSYPIRGLTWTPDLQLEYDSRGRRHYSAQSIYTKGLPKLLNGSRSQVSTH